MKSKWICVLLMVFLTVMFLVNGSLYCQELTGKEIMEKTENVESLKDLRGTIEMQIIHESGKKRIREMTMIGFENDKGIEKSMMRLIKPAKVKGTGFLSVSNPDGPDESYLYLPALGKPRRLSSEERGGHFMGSDFTYEDIAPTHEDYQHQLVKTEVIDGNDYYLVASIPKDDEMRQDVGFSKKLTWISKAHFNVLKMEARDINDHVIRMLTVSEYQEIEEGFWIPIVMEMKTIETGSRTILNYQNIETNVGLSDQDFSIRQLTRPL